MSGKTRSFFLSLTIIAVILVSAFGTTSAYADGGTTPDPPPTETSSGSEEAGAEATEPPAAPEEVTAEATEPPTEATATPEEVTAEATATEAPVEETSTESAETAEVTATPEPVATEASPTEEAAAAQPTKEAAPVVEEAAPAAETTVLDAVPENTTVTIVDENGQMQPLATQAAAEAVATSDPIWCPAGQPSNSPNCTPSFTSFNALLTFLSGNAAYAGPGTIYVQQGAYLGGESSIDFNSAAYDLTNIRNSALTVTGGWNPTTGLADPTTPSTFSNVPIFIGSSANPWGGSLTLSNIVTSFPNNADPSLNALNLYATGDVTLVNVQVGNAPNNGAEVEAGGSVTIVDSSFDRNQKTGAKIKSGGNVTIINSSFSNPPNGRRQDTGLDIQSTGGVSLVSVLANENRLAGTSINSGGAVSISDSFFSGTKEIQGANFLGYGLQVVSPTTVDLIGVTANDNFLWGANLQAGGNITIFNSLFNANTTASPGFIDDTGLFITGGANVDLQNVTANANRLYGAKIDAVGAVAINVGDFSDNQGIITTGGVTTYHGHGLAITSQSNITLNNVTALRNMLFGAELSSTVGDINVSNSEFSNTSTGSAANAVGQGLNISTGGSAILANVVLNNNQTFGAAIQARDVRLGNVTATGNGSDGVAINALCTSVDGGMFSGNTGNGLNLGTSGLELVAPPTAGDIFPAAPAVCTIVGGSPTTPGDISGATTVYAALLINPPQDYTIIPVTDAFTAGTTLPGVTLKSILDKVEAGGFFLGIFTGQYSYIYTDTGLQIFVLATPLGPAAVRGVFRAY